MRFFFTAVVCRLKLAVTRSLFAALVLFVMFLAFVTLAFGDRQVFVMNIGLLYPDTPYAERLAADFERYAAGNVHTVRYYTLDAMRKDVINGRLECAYVLPMEYAREDTIALYVTADTRGAAISNVMLASAYMQNMAADFGYKVLRHYLPGNKQEIMAHLSEGNASYLERGTFMEIEYVSRKSGREQPTGNRLYYAQNGVIALFSLLITMLICLGLVHERKTSISMRLTLAGDSAVYVFANITAMFLINLAFFSIATIITGAIPPLYVVVVYVFFVSIFGVSLGSAIKSESIFLGVTIMVFLCSTVLGGIFVDIGGLIPSLDVLKYLFATYYYMEGLKGSSIYAILAGTAVLLAGLLYFGDCFKRRRIFSK